MWLLTCASNMQANRTSSTSKTPAFSRVTWSSWGNNAKPVIRLANSTTPRMAGENRFEKSCKSSCWPVNGWGFGFKGQACDQKKQKKKREHISLVIFLKWVSFIYDRVFCVAHKAMMRKDGYRDRKKKSKLLFLCSETAWKVTRKPVRRTTLNEFSKPRRNDKYEEENIRYWSRRNEKCTYI